MRDKLVGMYYPAGGGDSSAAIWLVDGDKFAYSVDTDPDTLYVSVNTGPYESVGAALDAALDEDSQTTEYHGVASRGER